MLDVEFKKDSRKSLNTLFNPHVLTANAAITPSNSQASDRLGRTTGTGSRPVTPRCKKGAGISNGY